MAVEAEDRFLVLFRDSADTPIVLEDRCAHRNVPLSLGRVRKGRLQCAYHGWTYGSDGSVVEIPALAERPDPVPGFRVKKFHAEDQDGFIWVTLEQSRPTVSPPRFPYFKEKGWTSFVMKTRFQAPIEACLENFLDCPHAAFLHRYWFRSPTAKAVKATVRTLPDGAEAEFSEEPREKSLVWWLLAPMQGGMRHIDRFIAPRTSRVDYAFQNGMHYVITSSCTGLPGGETQVYTVITFRLGWLGPVVKLFFEPLSRRIIGQDVEMLGAQQRNLRRFSGARFSSSRADLLGRHIVAWRQALERGELPPSAGQQYDVDIRL